MSSSKVEGLVDGAYDLLVMTSSWDSRCLCLLDANITAKHGIGVFFANRGKTGLRDEHDPKVRTFLDQSCDSVEVIEHASEDLHGLWQRLWASLWHAYGQVRRPLNVLLDLSTCPRYYAMGLLSGGVFKGLIRSLSIFYTEGDYPEIPAADADDQFTAGRWQTSDVPYLTGTADPGNSRLYVVSVGFEGPKTFLAVSNNDADRVRVLLPQPGVKPDYPMRTRESNRFLYDEYGLDESDEIAAPAGDAIEAWAALAGAEPTKSGENPFYLCCGTKPHAIAMAIHAMMDDRVTVLYARPASHKETAIRPLPAHWVYRLTDVSSPPRP